MRVFVVPTWHPTPDRPLWTNWVLPHLQAARNQGVEVCVLQVDCDASAPGPARWVTDEHLYLPLPVNKWRWYRTRLFYGGLLAKYQAGLNELYTQAVRRYGRPDLLHAHVSLPAGYGAGVLGREQNLPVVVTEHYTGFESDVRFQWRVGHYVREMGRHLAGFYAVSPGFARRIERTGLLKVTGVLPNPIDTTLFHPSDIFEATEPIKFITTGRMSWRKGADLLFEALRQLPAEMDWRLQWFGSTEAAGQYARWLQDPALRDRIGLEGAVSQERLVEAYSQSDIYVVSSRIETANVSMLQAMACGAAVVTTACEAPETLLDAEVAIAVAPDDPGALARGLTQMAAHCRGIGRQVCRQYVCARYSVDVIGCALKRAYDDAVRNQHDCQECIGHDAAPLVAMGA